MKKEPIVYGFSLLLILVGVATIFSSLVPVDQIQESASLSKSPINVASQTFSPNLTLRYLEEQVSGKTSEENLTLVTKVIDGDTIEIEGGKRVRYIGIDTPETVDPRKSVQCFGPQASKKNKDLVEGRRVRLEKDVNETDKYDRLLRYIWVEETLINEILVKEGFARSSPYPPDVKYQDKLNDAQAFAQRENIGLWGSCNVAGINNSQSQTQARSNSCRIKGNISSSGEKIYHIPRQRYYNKTVVSESKGEVWFCSEKEAIEAGWRKSKV